VGVVQQFGEMGFETGEFGQRRSHLVEPSLKDTNHVFARCFTAVGDCEHLTYLVQRQAGGLGTPNKLQPVDELGSVLAVAAWGAGRGGQQTGVFVEPDCLGRHRGAAGEFADLHHISLTFHFTGMFIVGSGGATAGLGRDSKGRR
jgi:hypothetical protein